MGDDVAQIALDNIEKSFGATQVLKGVSLDIADGEFITLVGPSGCGKSTLLRILAGLEASDSGRVTIDGRDVTQVRPADRNLAMVFQSYALYPHLTVAENMMTPLRMREVGHMGRLPILGPLVAREAYRGMQAQVQTAAETLKIEALLDRKPGQLSGGQRQRVALGRAMVRQPLAFLMDEPLSNLDAALRVHMRAELSELHRRLKATFVYVTHDQAEALTMSDRMAVMMHGHILQLGAPDVIYADPNCLDVARFIGSPAINTLPGEISATGDITALGQALGAVRAAAGPVTVGLRPEHLTLDPNGAFKGKVTHRENLGSDIYLHLGLEGLDQPLVLRTEPGKPVPLGAELSVSADADEVLLFDVKGQRIYAPTLAREVA